MTAVPTPRSPGAPGSAEIYDRGYRPYDGPRTGVAGGMRSVYIASIQRALGLRRKFRFKIVPLLAIFISYIPAMAFLGIAVLLPSELASEVVAEYAGYFGLIGLAVILFTAFVAPELLSTDRRTGLFGLYMASPLNRIQYLATKVAALLSVLLMVTLFPVFFLMIGYTITDLGPEGFGNTVKLLAQISASGVLLALFFTLIGMAASSFTDRQGFASAGIVLVLVASSVLAGTLYEVADFDAWIQVLALPALPLDVIGRIFNDTEPQLEGVASWQAWGSFIGVCLVLIAIIGEGYRRLEVTK